MVLTFNSVLCFYQLLGRVHEATECHHSKNAPIIDLDVIDETPPIAIKTGILWRLDPCHLLSHARYQLSEHGVNEKGFDVLMGATGTGCNGHSIVLEIVGIAAAQIVPR